MKFRVRNILDRAGKTGHGAPNRSRRTAFTLLEALIAVAALGLLAVGLASIFDATGKTVTAGRRVSAFNAYASLIEQQLRADIARMTRDGVLVIRNEYADLDGSGVTLPTGDEIPLYDGDERARVRRIDELMFFAKGEFVSSRPALHPEYIAKSDAARIYYGHGQRAMDPGTFSANDPYYLPQVDGINGVQAEYPGRDTVGSPNRYASDWILLRQVVLLAPPRTSQVLVPGALSVLNMPPDDVHLEDSQNQISLQPAASHVFRCLERNFPTTLSANVVRNQTQLFRPLLSSGLVDIAACDLPMVRSIVTTASKFPGPSMSNQFFEAAGNDDPNETDNDGADGVFTQYGTSAGAFDPDVIDRMRAWMLDALPTNSQNPGSDHQRIRCELSPRNFLGAIDPNQVPYQLNSAEAAYRLADQVMLSSSNFLPRCTEFIVEFSFGKTWPSDPTSTQPPYDRLRAGQLVWHGMTRQVDGQDVASPYRNDVRLHEYFIPYTRINGSVQNHLVTTLLIHGREPNALPAAGVPIESCFGYFDPTFDPDTNNNGELDAASDAVSSTIPWAWPKLIRVTLSLADPADPTIERTFQFVFEVPDGN